MSISFSGFPLLLDIANQKKGLFQLFINTVWSIIWGFYSCHFKIEKNIFSLNRNVVQYEKLRFSFIFETSSSIKLMAELNMADGTCFFKVA